MAISRRRMEELTCQFLMMVEILCRENGLDVCDNIAQLSNITEEELAELNFPMKYYQKEHRRHELEKEEHEK